MLPTGEARLDVVYEPGVQRRQNPSIRYGIVHFAATFLLAPESASFSRSRKTAFSSDTPSSSSRMASFASSSGSGRSSESSIESSFSHLNPSSLNSRSFTSEIWNERQRSFFESDAFRLDLPSAP